MERCDWCLGDQLYIEYHDNEWGVPLFDDRGLFELLLLEAAQAGLNWLLILRKRDAFREAFDFFDPAAMAEYDENKVEELMRNEGIIRNRAKIRAFIQNSRMYLENFPRKGSFTDHLWSFVNGKPVINKFILVSDIPPFSVESEAMSGSLVRRGFKFAGPKVCYSLMQSAGMVNDHILSCFRYGRLSGIPAEGKDLLI